jgi:hypothetical protein
MDQTNILLKIDELFKKMNHLEKSLQEKSTPPIIVKMDVKDLHLQELKLEELAFHLDKLDIKELSGMLNLGNTFSPIVHRKPLPKKRTAEENQKKKEDKQQGKTQEIEVNINGKQVPYTIK